MPRLIAITEEEAQQLVADSLVLQEAIGSGLLEDDTAATLQLHIGDAAEAWFAKHPAFDDTDGR